MAPKDNLPKIIKSKRASKTMENSDEVVIIKTGVIGGKSVASEFTEEDVDTFPEKSGLPISSKTRIPKEDERLDDCPDGWIVFYDYPFKIGCRFPLNPLMKELLTIMQVSPAHIMPLVWRVVHVIDKLKQGMGMTFTVEDLLYLYQAKTVENTRYTFFLKPGRRSLVENSGANDRGWKKRYLFVNKKISGKRLRLPARRLEFRR